MTRKGWLLFAAISLFWGIPYLFIKVAVGQLDPVVVVVGRTGIAAAVLLPVAAYRGALRPLNRHWPAVASLALIQIAGPFLLISYGEQHISSSLTSLLIASEPLLIALLALHLDRAERVGGARFAGLLLGIGGVVMLLGLDVGGDRLALVGAGMVLLATAGYAASALMLRRRPYTVLPSLGVVAGECTVATVVLGPMALTRMPNHLPDAAVLASLAVLGLVCTAVAYLAFFALVAEVGASRGSVFTYVNPAVAVTLGAVVLGEPVGYTTVAGFLLIILGCLLSTGITIPPVLAARPRAPSLRGGALDAVAGKSQACDNSPGFARDAT